MIVLGLGFGDEGKGLTTSFLCSKVKQPLVVRFNGGHQAGHTVVHNGNRHVFSSFGSGTLQEVPTYWSTNCTFCPLSFVEEFKVLDKIQILIPQIFVNPFCPVTTPFDVQRNIELDKLTGHGTVGVGFGATLQRHKDDKYKLFVRDLFYESVLLEKLRNIATFYGVQDPADDIMRFIQAVRFIKKNELIELAGDFILGKFNPIFEGAQGILLDKDFGFFPNVTRSNTTSKNALMMYKNPAQQEIFYVTRSYLTRHGNGYLPNEQDLNLINNENETNIYNEFQGKFRTAELDPELINYAIACDDDFSYQLPKNLVITCMDQHPIDIDALLSKINIKFQHVFTCDGPSATHISKYK